MSKVKVVKKVLKVFCDYAPALIDTYMGVNAVNSYSSRQYQPIQAVQPPALYQPTYYIINNPPQFMQNPWMNLMSPMGVTQTMPCGQIPYQQPLMFGQPPKYSAMSPVPQYQSQSIPPELPPQY